MDWDVATILQLARYIMGTAILLTSLVTGRDSTFVIIGVVLLGLPVEFVTHAKSGTTQGQPQQSE